MSWGNNINFLSHVLGESTSKNEKNSAFIATSSDYQFTYTYARQIAEKIPEHIYYIYEIRATNNFYSAQLTMEHLCKINNRPAMPPELKGMLDEQTEYAALTYIPPTQVKLAVKLKYIPNQPIKITIEDNKNYDDKETYANQGPYTGSDKYPLSYKPILFIGPPLLPASFQSDSKEIYTQKPWPVQVVLNDEL